MNHTRACQILGVPTDASGPTIKLSYHQLARVWHPDRFVDDQPLRERAERQLCEINAAYDVCLKGAEAAEPLFERETPWYPPPPEPVMRSQARGYATGRSEQARPDYDSMGMFLLLVFAIVAAVMIVLVT